MGDQVLKVEERSEGGKNANRRLRAHGRIPAIFYGRGRESRSLSVDPSDLVKILTSETGQNTIFKVSLGDEQFDVLVRDYQLDPLKGTLLHADLQSIAMDEVREFEIPLEVVGNAPGVKAGGILDMVLRHIEVECLPGEVPEHFEVDVSLLEIGDVVRVRELNIDRPGLTVLSAPDLVAVTVVPPKVEEVEEPAEEEEVEGAEPELIQKGKAEEEEEQGSEKSGESE